MFKKLLPSYFDPILIFPVQQGETGANVLVAIQVAKSEMDEFHHQADSLGYEYEVVTDDSSFKLLLH